MLGEHDIVQPEDLPDEVVEGNAEIPSGFQAALRAYKRKLVLDAYRQADQDHDATASLLGVHTNSPHRMIRRLRSKKQLGALGR